MRPTGVTSNVNGTNPQIAPILYTDSQIGYLKSLMDSLSKPKKAAHGDSV